ncbi:MAG: winged helix-turn-helix domain-containing protein [Candidatus Aenigmatarchaeota archaeon]
MVFFKRREQPVEERLRRIEEMKRKAGGAKFYTVEDEPRHIGHVQEPARSDPFATASASGAALEILRDMKAKVETLTSKLAELERKFDERVPEKALSEQAFREEVVDGSSLAQEIIDGVREEVKAAANARPVIAARDQLTIVEQKRMEKVLSLLQEHGKLTSPQLANIMNLSRTRCNEYFRHMEQLGLVEGVEVGKEKYYKPCN